MAEASTTLCRVFEYGGVAGKTNYYVTGSYLHDGIGIENPTRTAKPDPRRPDQYRMFGVRFVHCRRHQPIVLLTSGYHGDFEIPNNPDKRHSSPTWEDRHSTRPKLNETQVEQDAYAILAYQKKIDDFNMAGVGFHPL